MPDGEPAWSPYAAPIRAIVIGRSNVAAQYRATASSAILEMEYGVAGGRHRSPSGSSSRNGCQGSGCGLYTVTVDITSAAFALRQCWSSSPVPSALTRGPLVVVGAEVGRDVQQIGEVSREVAEVALGQVGRPRRHAELLVARAAGSENRAIPQTSLSAASVWCAVGDPPGRPGDQDLLVAQLGGNFDQT